MAVQTQIEAVTGGFCPHCHLLAEPGVSAPWPAVPVRCPHCHLLIGAGRSRSEPSGEPGAKGTAAGVFSRQARRLGTAAGAEGEAGHSPGKVLDAIRAVAGAVGQRPERLLMVDYQQLAVADAAIPPLSDVISVFGSWKNARREAAEAA